MQSIDLLRSVLNNVNRTLDYAPSGEIKLSVFEEAQYISFDKDQEPIMFWLVFPLYVVALKQQTVRNDVAWRVLFNTVLCTLQEGRDNHGVESLLNNITSNEGFFDVKTFHSMAADFFPYSASSN